MPTKGRPQELSSEAIRKKLGFGIAFAALALSLVALFFAAYAPEAMASSRWLSLPGLAMPGWSPLFAAGTGLLLLQSGCEKLSLLMALAAVVSALATILACAAALA